jgi:hypothetical protein
MDEDEIDPAHSLPEPETVNHLREFAIERIDDVWMRAFRIVRCVKPGKKGKSLKDMMLDAMMLAFGKNSEIGLSSSSELAKRHKCTKANANKYVNQFRDLIAPGLNRNDETLPGQRDFNARQKFAKLQKERCQPTN